MVYTTIPEKNYAYENVYREYIFDDTSVLKGYNGLSDTNTTLLDADFETASATLDKEGKGYGFACLATNANGNKYVELGRGASDHGGLKFNTVSEDTESEDIAYYVMQADLKLIALNPVPTKADNWPIRMRMYSGAKYFCEIEIYPVFDAEGKVTHVQLSKQPAIAVSSTADFITLTLKYDVVNNSGKLYINGVEAGPLKISSNPDNVFSYGYISLRGATYCYGEKLVIGIDNVKLYGIEYK
jgi:hypothetical protein